MKEKGKLQLEWPHPPPDFGITDTAFEDLSRAPQILYLRSQIQGGGAGGIFVCRECKLTFAKDRVFLCCNNIEDVSEVKRVYVTFSGNDYVFLLKLTVNSLKKVHVKLYWLERRVIRQINFFLLFRKWCSLENSTLSLLHRLSYAKTAPSIFLKL